jgi:hypothetical protein
MSTAAANGTPKIHPASREMLPDDPMELQGFELEGDPELMLRLLVEEYARLGFDAGAIIQLAVDPQYQAFDGLRRAFGEDGIRRRVSEVVARCGVMRVKTAEAPLDEGELVQIELPR